MRAYKTFPRTRPITVRASGERTAARHLIGYPSTNRLRPSTQARRIRYLRAVRALKVAEIFKKNIVYLSQFGNFSRRYSYTSFQPA